MRKFWCRFLIYLFTASTVGRDALTWQAWATPRWGETAAWCFSLFVLLFMSAVVVNCLEDLCKIYYEEGVAAQKKEVVGMIDNMLKAAKEKKDALAT